MRVVELAWVVDMRDRTILISGIGIAGPTLAYWLGRYGYKATLIEQAPRLRTGGYVIDFWGLGFDVAERMGLLPTLQRDGNLYQELRFVDARGQRVGGFNADVFPTLTDGRYVSLPRGDLAALIYNSIKGDHEVIFGDSITAIEQDDDSVQVTFQHAPARRFDLVIGADGLHSEVRRLVFGSQDQFETYLGYMVAAFEVEGYRPRDEGYFVSYSAPGRQAGRLALDNDRTLFLLVFAANQAPRIDPHDTNAQKRVLIAEFSEAGWECPQILAELENTNEFYFDRVSQIRMNSWSRGRVALLGDAAFCPSLLAGQGSALAMTAAYVLAGELGCKDGAPEEAFQRYEELLKPFMAGKQKAAEQFATSFAPRTRWGIYLRNQVMNAFRLPYVAKLVLGRTLLDHLQLPIYSAHH